MKTGFSGAILRATVIWNRAGMCPDAFESMRLLGEIVINEIEGTLGIVGRPHIKWVMESEMDRDGSELLTVKADSSYMFSIGYDDLLGRLYLTDVCQSTGEATVMDVVASAIDVLRA